MKHNSFKKVWLCIFLLSMYCNAFASNNNGVTIIDVPSQGDANDLGNIIYWCKWDDNTSYSNPTDGPKHIPSNKGLRIQVEVFFHDAYGNVSIIIFKDGCSVVYEGGIIASPEEPLQYDLTPYGHGSYYICIMNGSAVLYDGYVEL